MSTMELSQMKNEITELKLSDFISKIEDPRIVLLRNIEVLQWLLGDLSFLGPIDTKNKTQDNKKYKVLEDKWGQSLMQMRRPDLNSSGQWTTKFGEYICEELYLLQGYSVSKPVKKENYEPDHETEDFILEAKTQTFYTSGTAGEKIMGTAFKYTDIPELYGKPLKIVCMGGAEKVCRELYGNLPGPKCTPKKMRALEYHRKEGVEFVGATNILRSFIIVEST